MAVQRSRKSARRPVTKEDLLTLKLVRSGSVSPDGRHFAFTVETARKDRKGYNANLYVVGVEDGVVRQFTHGKKGDRGPVFSPDGRLIAFTGKRANFPGIYLLPVDGGEARTLVEKDGGFASLSFSPDGKKILCTFRPADPPPPSGDPQEKPKEPAVIDEDTPAPKREAPVCREIDRLFYRLDGVGFLPKAEAQVWIFDVATGEGVQVTNAKRSATDPAFSPDGRTIAYVTNIRPDPDLEMAWNDLFIVPSKGGKARLIPTPPGPISKPAFSPDGKAIAYLGHDDIVDPWYEMGRVWTVPADGRGKAKCLAPRFDQPASDATISDTGEGFFELAPKWTPDGRWIYFLSSSFGASGIYRVRARGGTPEQVTPEKVHLSSADLTLDRKTAVGIVATATAPAEVYRLDLRSGVALQLTTLNRAWAAELDIQRPIEVRVRSTERTNVQAWVLRPPRFNPRRKYPAIVEVHGGPMAQYGYSYFHEMQLLAANGFVVYYSNPRGSLGYGRAFAEAIKNDWGNRDYADVLAGTDFLESLPYVDKKRIGITGGSYGGYMTNWAVGHTRRYKAAVTQRSVVDLVPFFGSSDSGFLFHYEFGGHPWTAEAEYKRMSPLTYAEKIRTPLLILHNENDLRCAIEQAENLFATLKVLGRRVEFVRFPEEPHGMSRMGRPDRRLMRLEKIVGWFKRYL